MIHMCHVPLLACIKAEDLSVRGVCACGVPVPNPRPVSLHRAVRGCMAYLRAL